jgi:hypothetical protein
MQIIQALPFRFDKAAARRPTRPRRSDATPVRRRETSGGPQDRAFYSCGCGYAFTADVTTSVACPHCRTAQAW